MIAPIIVKPANFHTSLRFGASFLKAFTGSDSESLPIAISPKNIASPIKNVIKRYKSTKAEPPF